MAFVWEQRKLGKIVEVHNGKDYKHLEKGNIPVYGTGGYMLSVSESLSDTQDAIGIGRKGTIDKPYILRAPFWTVDTLFYCIPREENDLNFIFDIFQNINWRLMDESTGVPSLSKKSINNVKILVPNKKEQKQIGLYFNQLDHLITLHQRKRMLRKCFFSIDWEQRKLGDVLETIKDGTHGTHQDANEGPLLLSAKNIRNGTIIWDESDRRISINEYEKIHSKFKLKKNDVLLTIVGSIGETAILKDISGITFQRSVAFLRTSEQITPEFLCSEIQTQQFQKKLNDRKSTSAQPGIYLGDLSEIPFVYSKNKDEQVKIGQYFSNLDKLITLHQCKSNFCKKNEVNAWEQCKFGELVDKYEDLVETPTDGYMRLGIRSHAKGTFYSYVEKGKELETAKMFRVAANNFIVNITFGWEHAVAITDENDAGKLVSHRFPQYQFHKGMIPKFFKYLILDESFKHHLELSSPGGAGRNRVLKLNDMLNYQMRFPSEQEQKKVANYFDTLDTLITLHQWECNINENTEGNDEKQRKPIKKLIISEGNLSLVDDMFLLHRMTFLVCNKYILLRLNVVKYKITIIIISNILYSIVSLLIIACYLIVINKQLIILIYVEISVVIIKGDDDYARIRS